MSRKEWMITTTTTTRRRICQDMQLPVLPSSSSADARGGDGGYRRSAFLLVRGSREGTRCGSCNLQSARQEDTFKVAAAEKRSTRKNSGKYPMPVPSITGDHLCNGGGMLHARDCREKRTHFRVRSTSSVEYIVQGGQ